VADLLYVSTHEAYSLKKPPWHCRVHDRDAGGFFPRHSIGGGKPGTTGATLEAATKVSVPLLNAGDNAPIHESTPGSCLHCSAGRHRHFHSPETGEYDGWVARGSGRETLGLDLSQHGEKAYND